MDTSGVTKNAAKRRSSTEDGYTFVEVLIVVAVIAALAVGAFALFTGRGKTTEMTALAQQVGQTVQSQQQLIFRGFRNGKVTSSEMAGSLNSLLADHRFIIGVSSNQSACDTPSATKSGLVFNLNPVEFDTTEEAGEMQSIIHAALNNVFTDEDGNAFTDDRSFHDVIDISSVGPNNMASAYLGDSAAASFATGTPNVALANACLDNT